LIDSIDRGRRNRLDVRVGNVLALLNGSEEIEIDGG